MICQGWHCSAFQAGLCQAWQITSRHCGRKSCRHLFWQKKKKNKCTVLGFLGPFDLFLVQDNPQKMKYPNWIQWWMDTIYREQVSTMDSWRCTTNFWPKTLLTMDNSIINYGPWTLFLGVKDNFLSLPWIVQEYFFKISYFLPYFLFIFTIFEVILAKSSFLLYLFTTDNFFEKVSNWALPFKI